MCAGRGRLEHFVYSGDDFAGGNCFNRPAFVVIWHASFAAEHSIGRLGPRMPHIGIGRTEHRYQRTPERRGNMHRPAVVADKHASDVSDQRLQLGKRHSRQDMRSEAAALGYLFSELLLPGSGNDYALELPATGHMIDHRSESASAPAF